MFIDNLQSTKIYNPTEIYEMIELTPNKPSIPSVKLVALETPTNIKTINTPYKNFKSILIPSGNKILLPTLIDNIFINYPL